MSRRPSHRSLLKRKVRSLFLETLEQRLPFDAAVGSLSMSFIDRAADSDLASSKLIARNMGDYDSWTVATPIDSTPSNPPPTLLNPVAVSDDFAQFNSIEDWRDALVQRQMVIHQNSFSTRYDGYQDTFTWDPDPTDDEAPWTIARVWGDGTYPYNPMFCGDMSSSLSSFSTAAKFNSTPVQVAGIDEGDIVETDGRYLYVMRLGEILIIDGERSGEESIVSRFTLSPHQNYSAREMYLHDGQLTVISDSYSGSYFTSDGITFEGDRYHQRTTIQTYNVAQPDQVTLEHESFVEGAYQQSRMVDDRLIVVTYAWQPWLSSLGQEWVAPIYGEEEIPTSALPEGQTLWEGQSLKRVLQTGYTQFESREDYLERIRTEVAEFALPRFGQVENGVDAPITFTELVTPENWYLPPGEAWATSEIYTVTSIDVNAPTESISSYSIGLDSSISALYMSETGVYVASSSGAAINNFWGGIDWARTATFSTETTLFKFGFAEDGQLSQPQSITLQGSVQNQFWLDEQQGDLRVVTTSPTGPRLYVLRSEDNDLQVVSTLENFSPNEDVYSVRYVEDKAYIVTFPTNNGEINYQRVQRIDPLFVIDLSSAEQPTVLGELEIPGFSDYLLPIDDKYLLGVGRNVDPETGADLGLQVSVFDVSDWSHPEMVSRYSFEGGSSTQTQGVWSGWGQTTVKHHAFTYLPEQRLFAIPIYTSQWNENEEEIFSRTNEAAVRLLKINEYGELAAEGQILFNEEFAQNLEYRTLSMGDSLYFVSPHVVQVTSLADPATVIDTIQLQNAPLIFEPPTEFMPIRNWEAEVQESIRIAETLGMRPEVIPAEAIPPEELPTELIDPMVQTELPPMSEPSAMSEAPVLNEETPIPSVEHVPSEIEALPPVVSEIVMEDPIDFADEDFSLLFASANSVASPQEAETNDDSLLLLLAVASKMQTSSNVGSEPGYAEASEDLLVTLADLKPLENIPAANTQLPE
jgi:inhibitor of cysteine peptidase